MQKGLFMKTLFIHLSDLHIDDSKSGLLNQKNIIENITEKIRASNNIFVIFTGDFSNEGLDSQINLFKQIIDGFINEIKAISSDAFVQAIIVPGNHDVNLEKEKKNGYPIDFTKKYTSEELDNISDSYIRNMSPALNLCREYGCFLNDEYVDSVAYEDDEFIYHFSILNSAPMSSLNKQDKEHHHVPNKSLNQLGQNLKIGKKTIEIFLSHHRTDWFDYSTKSKLDSYIKESVSIAFFGHEHQQDNSIIIRDKKHLINVYGGELIDKNNNLVGSFNTLMFDECSLIPLFGVHSFDYQKNEYHYSGDESHEKIEFFQKFKISNEFYKEEFKTPISGFDGDIMSLFVMPTLYKNNKPYISKVSSLIAYLDKNKEIIIKGNAKSGKSILLRFLYLQLSKKYVPVLVDCKNVTSPIPKNIINSEFLHQYDNENKRLEVFDALPKNNKAIIIDNFHNLKQETMTKVLEYARNNFEIVVIAFRNSYDPTKRLIEDSIIGFDDNVFQLYQFSYLERKQFITNICKTMGVESQNYDKVFKIYEATVSTSKILDFCDPEYALLLTENIIKNKNYEDRNISSAFSIAFTHSVENAFYSAGCESKIDDCLLLTSWLAKKLWKRKRGLSI